MRKKAVMLAPVTAVIVVVLTLLVSFAPASVDAATGTRYAAGNETSGTHICNCPVTVGNCVCAYTDPQPKEQEPGTIAAN
jgi:hypothetical protein